MIVQNVYLKATASAADPQGDLFLGVGQRPMGRPDTFFDGSYTFRVPRCESGDLSSLFCFLGPEDVSLATGGSFINFYNPSELIINFFQKKPTCSMDLFSNAPRTCFKDLPDPRTTQVKSQDAAECNTKKTIACRVRDKCENQ